jgi:hypothetical protein
MNTNKERILVLEILNKQMAIDINTIKEDVKDINGKFDLMLEKLDKKFAAKRTETVMKFLIGTILITVI